MSRHLEGVAREESCHGQSVSPLVPMDLYTFVIVVTVKFKHFEQIAYFELMYYTCHLFTYRNIFICTRIIDIHVCRIVLSL